MTAKDFLMRELNLSEEYLKETMINSKMVCDMMEAYHQEMKRIEKPEDYFGRNEKMVTGNSSVNVGYSQQNSSIA